MLSGSIGTSPDTHVQSDVQSDGNFLRKFLGQTRLGRGRSIANTQRCKLLHKIAGIMILRHLTLEFYNGNVLLRRDNFV